MPRTPRILAVAAAVTVGAAAVALAAAPTATTGPVAGVGQSSATLTATVDPQGEATSVRFDLGTGSGYGLQSAAKDAGAGTTATTVEIGVQGLTAGTTYHYRVVATNATGAVQGADATFTTASAPVRPAVSTGTVRDTTTSATTLTGSVDPQGQATTYRFQYGTSTRYGSTTAPAVVTVRSAARVGILSVRRTRGRRVTVSGRVLPATARAVASLQRLARNGTWVPLRRATVGTDGRYRITVLRRAGKMPVRVVGLAHDGGAHARGVSRTVTLPSRR